MSVPAGLFFTKEHEWVKIEGDQAKMGISDYAQQSLGDITFVEFPAVGADVKQFAQIASIESVKAASDIYAPLSGKVLAINDKIADNPELVNQSPYEQGWFLTIDISNPDEKNNLMNADVYKKYLEEVAH